MSWVTDVILLAGLRERIAGGKLLDVPKPVAAVNKWLKRGKWAPLTDLGEGVNSEKAFQACAYGGALNHLDIPGFLDVVGKQSWQNPGGVMLLLQEEEQEAFTAYRIGTGGAMLKLS